MRIFFTSDLHGKASLYDQLDDFLRSEAPDLLILGGDLFADGQADDPPGSQAAWITHEFVPRVERWRAAANDLTVACLVGNHDWVPTRDLLRELHASGLFILLEEKAPWAQDGVDFIGYPCTPPTPHNVKDFERLDLPGDGPPPFGGAVLVAGEEHVEVAEDVGLDARAGEVEADLALLDGVDDEALEEGVELDGDVVQPVVQQRGLVKGEQLLVLFPEIVDHKGSKREIGAL